MFVSAVTVRTCIPLVSFSVALYKVPDLRLAAIVLGPRVKLSVPHVFLMSTAPYTPNSIPLPTPHESETFIAIGRRRFLTAVNLTSNGSEFTGRKPLH